MSDSNANTLPKILNFTTYKMKHASIFFIFSNFFASSDDFLILPSTFACWKTYFQKSSRNCSKIGTRNSTRNWKIVTRIDSIENFHNWFWARLDSKIYQLDSTRFDKFSTRSTPIVQLLIMFFEIMLTCYTTYYVGLILGIHNHNQSIFYDYRKIIVKI